MGLDKQPGVDLHGAENARHGKNHEKRDEEEEEECTGCAIQIGHKVQNDVIKDAIHNLVGHVDDDGRKRLGRRVMEPIPVMLLYNRPLRILRQDLERAGKGIRQNRHEQQRAALEKARRRGLQVVKQRRYNQRRDRVCDQGKDAQARVSCKTPPSSPETQLDLLRVRQDKGRPGPLPLGLLLPLILPKRVGVGAAQRMRLVKRVNFCQQASSFRALQPAPREFVGGSRRAALVAWLDDSLRRGRHGREEVGRRLPVGAGEAETDKVRLGLARWPKVDLPALVEHEDLVEEVVCALGRLVDGHGAGAAKHVRLQPQRFAKLNRVGRVEAAGGIIPALERRAGQRGLGNRHSLPFAARHAADVLVADARICRVADSVHGHDHVSIVSGELASRYAGRYAVRLSGAGCKGQGVSDRQHWEMDVDFGRVDGLSFVLGVHLVRGYALVVERGRLVDVDSVCFSRDALEKCGAAGAGGAKNHKHLARFHDTVETAEDVDPLRVAPAVASAYPAHQAAQEAACHQPYVADVLLVVCLLAKAIYIEIGEGESCVAKSRTRFSRRLRHRLCPGTGIELGPVWIERGVGIIVTKYASSITVNSHGGISSITTSKVLHKRVSPVGLRVRGVAVSLARDIRFSGKMACLVMTGRGMTGIFSHCRSARSCFENRPFAALC